MRRRWQVYLGLLISAFFTYRVLEKIWAEVDRVWYYLSRAQYLWIIPGVAVYFFGVWARTWRWHYMLRPIQRVPLKRLFPVVCIGYMGNNIYPFRAGEVLRAYVLQREEGISISASLATVLAERIFDGIVMLLFVFIGLPFLPSIPPDLRRWVVIFTLLFFGALAVFFAIAASPRLTQAFYNWFIDRLLPERFRQPVRGVADRFLEGLRCLRSPADLAMIFVTSVVVWLAETTKYWFVMHGFIFTAAETGFPVPFYVLMLMNGVVNLFTTLPAAPGYIGTFDDPGIEVLSTFGVEPAVATAYTVALHAALWLPITLLGAFYMLRRGLSWGKVQREVGEERLKVEG
ncbi:MAG: flippase-like domain-containing protein [Chloroflexia bacterium]|nr:flippase-like domain-containing protein [Chloroflexia bacterium]